MRFPPSMRVFERGWLSSNCVLLVDDDGATLVDSGFDAHREQTAALVDNELRPRGVPLRRVINTHLHSDHCGGNAHLATTTGCAIAVPVGYADAVRAWDLARLSFDLVGQRCTRFAAADTLAAGDVLVLGGFAWTALAAPGHDDDTLILHCESEGILISSDALWENGSGAMFPGADPAALARDFDAAFATLDLIASLRVRVVVPGHGAPFDDVGGALARARARLRVLADDPERNGWQAIRTLVKFRLLDERRMPLAAVCALLDQVPVIRHARRDVRGTTDEIATKLVDDLVAKRAATFADGVLVDR